MEQANEPLDPSCSPRRPARGRTFLPGASHGGHKVTAVTTTTPPGWYPNPGTQATAQPWNAGGTTTTWTEYTRTAPTASDPQMSPCPAVTCSHRPGGGRRTSAVVIAVVAALVLIGAVAAASWCWAKAATTQTPRPSRPALRLPHPGTAGAPPPGRRAPPVCRREPVAATAAQERPRRVQRRQPAGPQRLEGNLAATASAPTSSSAALPSR